MCCANIDPCGARMVVAHCLILGPNSLGWQGRERGGGISPYDDIRGKFQNGASELRFFKGGAECLLLVLHPTKCLAIWGA